ncbi:hypothetical protein CMO96_01730 [Candidatus Woesebacteria bacterium]|nr:hypothetical protein [Candidatus Woesebacteria bacterium]
MFSYIKKFLLVIAFLSWSVAFFIGGYLTGATDAFKISDENQQKLLSLLSQKPLQSPSPLPIKQPSPSPEPEAPVKQKIQLPISYSGPDLWDAVNEARLANGVNSLNQKDILCTISAIRLSQVRELGKLDGHDGFQGVYDKYKDNTDMPGNVSEFLISGYPTPEQAVEGWIDTLGHKKLITGGEYKWGCIYAADGFGVAITGF